MKKIIIFVLVLFSSILKSQPMRYVKSEFEAKYRVYFTNTETEANVIGYKVQSYYDCTKPGYIYIAPVWFKSATPVFIVDNKSKADLIIYWTDKKSKAKWLK